MCRCRSVSVCVCVRAYVCVVVCGCESVCVDVRLAMRGFVWACVFLFVCFDVVLWLLRALQVLPAETWLTVYRRLPVLVVLIVFGVFFGDRFDSNICSS